MANNKVDPSDPLPRYYQVYLSLLERIRTGEFKQGDAIPSERQLVGDYSTSRITIVKALDLLGREGLIGSGRRVCGVEKYARTASRSSGALGAVANEVPRNAFKAGSDALT